MQDSFDGIIPERIFPILCPIFEFFSYVNECRPFTIIPFREILRIVFIPSVIRAGALNWPSFLGCYLNLWFLASGYFWKKTNTLLLETRTFSAAVMPTISGDLFKPAVEMCSVLTRGEPDAEKKHIPHSDLSHCFP